MDKSPVHHRANTQKDPSRLWGLNQEPSCCDRDVHANRGQASSSTLTGWLVMKGGSAGKKAKSIRQKIYHLHRLIHATPDHSVVKVITDQIKAASV